MKKIILLLFIGISLNAFAQHPCVGPTVTISGTDWKCKGVRDTLTVSGPNGTTYQWSEGYTQTTIFTGPIDADSTFYVVATNGGCSDTTYFNVTLRLPPVITFNPPTICLGVETCVTANATGTNSPFTYLWSMGETTDSICVTPTDSMPFIIVTVSNGCKATKMLTATNCTGINNITESSVINIYPNPSSTSFTLDLPTKSQIKVCDITGRVIFSKMENAGTITFGKELNPGIYFLFIDGKPGGKIVKL